MGPTGQDAGPSHVSSQRCRYSLTAQQAEPNGDKINSLIFKSVPFPVRD